MTDYLDSRQRRIKRWLGNVILLIATNAVAAPDVINPMLRADWALTAHRIAVLIAVLLGVALPIVPIYVYLKSGWKAKRDEISDGLTEDARKCYLVMFSMSALKADADRLHQNAAGPDARTSKDKVFEAFYTRWYGRHHFMLPILLLVGVLVFSCVTVGMTAAGNFPYWKPHEPAFYAIPATAVAALAGAYLWITSDFVSRSRRLDFAPSDISWAVLRMVIAVPMGYAFAGIAAPAVGPVLAFALGAFPLAAIQDILRQTVYKATMQTQTAMLHNDAVTKLQGVDDDIANRLSNEGVTTIPQLAYCDPVRLVMRSNLTFNFVIDCMNQALSWIYFEDQLAVLRPLGLRGAAEISFLMNALESTDPDTKREAESTLKDVANAIKPPHTEATLRYTFGQIANDPYTRFLNAIWTDPFLPADRREKT